MKVPKFILPVLVLAALLGGYAMRNAFTQPTTSVVLAGEGRSTVSCIVDGVKCKGTASLFTNLYADVPGIRSIVTYATEHRVMFQYDPTLITSDSIRAIMEAPIPLRDGSARQLFTCRSME